MQQLCVYILCNNCLLIYCAKNVFWYFFQKLSVDILCNNCLLIFCETVDIFCNNCVDNTILYNNCLLIYCATVDILWNNCLLIILYCTTTVCGYIVQQLPVDILCNNCLWIYCVLLFLCFQDLMCQIYLMYIKQYLISILI